MALCSHCGVEVEDAAQSCPLCLRPLHPGSHDVPPPASSQIPGPPETPRRLRIWLLELASVVTLTVVIVLLAIDLTFCGSPTWSRYPLASLGFLWASAALIMFASHRPLLYLPAHIAAVSLFLFVLDRFTPGPAWFLPLALPITLFGTVVLALTLLIVRGLRPPFVGSIATVMSAAALFVVGLDLLLNRYSGNRWFMSWSVVCSACLLPIFLLLLFLRRWFRAKQVELRKLLHH